MKIENLLKSKSFRRITKRTTSAQFLSGTIGLFFALLFVGPYAMIPTNTTWLYRGDAAAGQIAWEYFRRTPLLQWPITLIPDYGVGWSTYFTGAGGNVLIGLPLKFINNILPNNFQYVGLWSAACFVLQGYFAAKILNRFIVNRVLVVILSTNFILAPIFIYRIGLMSHPQLGAQWLLLCAIYFYVLRNKKIWQWSILVVVSHLTELYMSAAILLVICCFIFSEFISRSKQTEITHLIKLMVSTVSISGFLLWILGFFALPGGTKGEGFFRYGIATFLDPRASDSSSSSLIFNSLKKDPTQTLGLLTGESFTYLGTGIVIGALLAIVLCSKQIRRVNFQFYIFGLLGVTLFLVGLSQMVSIGPFEFKYWWPELLIEFRQTFRAATRFGWLLYYLVYVAIAVLIGRLSLRLKKQFLIPVLILLIGAIDQFPLYASTFDYFRGKPTQDFFSESKIDESFSQYQKVYIFPVFDLQEDRSTELESESLWRDSANFINVLQLASQIGASSNFAYQSRSVGSVIEIENKLLRDRIRTGKIEPGELFAFSNREDQVQFLDNCEDAVAVFVYRNVYFVGRSR